MNTVDINNKPLKVGDKVAYSGRYSEILRIGTVVEIISCISVLVKSDASPHATQRGKKRRAFQEVIKV